MDIHNTPHAPMRPQQHQPILSNGDFLKGVEDIKSDILTLTTNISKISTLHQSLLNNSTHSPDLENLTTQTQILNTSIKDRIKLLETDAARSPGNAVKDSQVKLLKTSFARHLQDYRHAEATYERQYREQIRRQYEIVHPDATEAEKREAAEADWGNEGVFQTALMTNRSATATTVLGAVRARHRDVRKIEETIVQLNQLMEDLATAVVLQEEPIQATEQHAVAVQQDMEQGNEQLSKGIVHARRSRRLKWWCLLIVVLIIIIVALTVGILCRLSTVCNSHKAFLNN